MKIFIALFIPALLSFACSSTEEAGKQNFDLLKQDILGNWYGELPCADCESISYQLTLNDDYTFKEQSVYIGRGSEPFIENGKWEFISNLTIKITNGDFEKMFLISDDELIMLDKDGNRIESEFKSKYYLKREKIEQNPDTYRKMFENGIDFIARGNEPFWNLQIDFDKDIKFISLTDISEFIVPPVKGEKNEDGKVITYSSITEAGEIIITVSENTCSDNMSGEEFSHTVSVKIKRKSDDNFTEFSGCGKFLMDYRLNDIWVMQEMTNIKLNKEELMKGLPVFEFHLNDKRFAGHAGCNNLNSSIEVIGDKITFGKILTTLMACPNMEVERKVSTALNESTFIYKIEKLGLTLENKLGIKMIFKKTD